MIMTSLQKTAAALITDGRGLLAMDESIGTCNKRFAALNIPQTEEARKAYRFLLVTTPNLKKSVSGVILYDETIHYRTHSGIGFAQLVHEAGLIAGIKVDSGAKKMSATNGEKVTEGLDGLRQRLAAYYSMGARFAKWRAVFSISANTPSRACVEANANALARYASLCQEAGLLPIVEPEVLMAGDHSLARCAAVTENVLSQIFAHLRVQNVVLEELILKANMVLPGIGCVDQASTKQIAEATYNCLLRSVPAAVPAVAFLSGGQSPKKASERLGAINQIGLRAPWALTFSFARALQQPALNIWRGDEDKRGLAQQELSYWAECNRRARLGGYDVRSENVL